MAAGALKRPAAAMKRPAAAMACPIVLGIHERAARVCDATAGDVASCIAALSEWSQDDLRKLARVLGVHCNIGEDKHVGRTLTLRKHELVPLCAESLIARPLGVTKDFWQGIEASQATTSKQKESMSPRIMITLVRCLGPLWSELLQGDSEYFQTNIHRFRRHDGLTMMLLQFKYPSLISLILDEIDKARVAVLGADVVTAALRCAASAWCHVDAEADNLDSQGVCRFFGHICFSRFGVVHVDPAGPLTFGKTQITRYAFSDGPSSIVDAYLQLDFKISTDDDVCTAMKKLDACLDALPSSQLMGGDYIRPWVKRTFSDGKGLAACTAATTVREYQQHYPDKCCWLRKLAMSPDERIVDLCARIGFPGRAHHLTAVTCLLDDKRLLQLLPADGDLRSFLQCRVQESPEREGWVRPGVG